MNEMIMVMLEDSQESAPVVCDLSFFLLILVMAIVICGVCFYGFSQDK